MKLSLWAVLAILALVAAWTKEDHEIFRLKDELEAIEGPGVTFYDFLGITPSATQEEITKAFRKKGKTMHPDKAKQAFIASRVASASKKARASVRSASSKAKTEGKSTKAPKPTSQAIKQPSEREVRAVTKKATENFARLGLINRILQGPERERYDHFLQNGFPAWRGTGYYYSRYRPGGGTVLFGLFVFAGGAVHYLVLVIGWQRRRDFVQRYIQQARSLAWGDTSPIASIPGLDDAGQTVATAQADDLGGDGASSTMNRRERRAQEKAKKKPSAKDRAKGKGADSGTATPANESEPGATNAGPAGPVQGPRKRVLAENGKTLVVDSAGNVFLEEMVKSEDAESDEEGEAQLFLLDADEMPRPTIRDTMVYRLPGWLYHKAKDAIAGAGQSQEEAGEGEGRRRRKVPLKPKPGQFGEAASAEAASTLMVPGMDAIPVVSGTSSGDDEVDGFVAVGEKVTSSSSGTAKKRKGKKSR